MLLFLTESKAFLKSKNATKRGCLLTLVVVHITALNIKEA